MFSLFLATLSSASIALLFKFTEGGIFNRSRLTTANYFAAFSFSLILFSYRVFLSKQSFRSIMLEVHWVTVLGIGIPTGIAFFASFMLYQRSVRDNGASLSAMAGKLGILLPMLGSILLWQEWPTSVQMFGIALAISAIIYINSAPKGEGSVKLSLILLFIIGGLGEFSNKFFQVYGKLQDQSLFLFTVFATAFTLSAYFSLVETPKEGSSLKNDLLLGLMIGIPNLLSSYFLIAALGTIPAAIAFPGFSAGTILLVTLISQLIFKEKITKHSFIGLAMTLIALLLIF